LPRVAIDKEQLKCLVQKGVSRPELALHFNCSVRTIANRIKEYGFLGLTPNNKSLPVINGEKKCRRCNTLKAISEFNLSTKKLDGLRNCCRECESSYYTENRDRIRLKHKAHYTKNKESYAARATNRRAAKLKATPKWFSELDHIILEEMYAINMLRKDMFGIQYHIDHIVPLQGNNVSGLHYHQNWQILTAQENFKKSNKHYE
jgi:hypothetical protein